VPQAVGHERHDGVQAPRLIIVAAPERCAKRSPHHRHSGLGFLTPAVVHFGHADVVRAHRDRVLAAAYARLPSAS